MEDKVFNEYELVRAAKEYAREWMAHKGSTTYDTILEYLKDK